MMKNLLLQEEGGGGQVYKHLLSRGWTPTGSPDGLNNGANLLFIVPYYWGVWRPEYEKILSKQKPGTFYTGCHSYSIFRMGSGSQREGAKMEMCSSFALSPGAKNVFALVGDSSSTFHSPLQLGVLGVESIILLSILCG